MLHIVFVDTSAPDVEALERAIVRALDALAHGRERVKISASRRLYLERVAQIGARPWAVMNGPILIGQSAVISGSLEFDLRLDCTGIDAWPWDEVNTDRAVKSPFVTSPIHLERDGWRTRRRATLS